MVPARIEIRLLADEVPVHEFRRSTTLMMPDSMPKMLQEALGWLQAYAAQVSNEQFLADAERVKKLVA